MEAALEAGAEDVVANDDASTDVLTDPVDFDSVRDIMTTAGLEPDNAEITMRAATSMTLDEKDAAAMMKLLETLEELEDVQQVYSNAEIPDAILERL